MKNEYRTIRHIAAVISKNLTGDEAEDLLGMMTRNSTDARIGNSLVVPSTMALYLMHMPMDVVSNIPVLDVTNSPTGAQPRSFWDYLFDTLIGIADFLWRGLVATLQFMLYVALAMTGIGFLIYILCDPGVQAAISQAINKIVDLFKMLLNWAIIFIIELANFAFGPIINALNQCSEEYGDGVDNALVNAQHDVKGTNTISSRTKMEVQTAVHGAFFWIVTGIVIVIEAILIAITCLANVIGFLIGIVVGIIVTLLLEQVVGGGIGSMLNEFLDLSSWNLLYDWGMKNGAGQPGEDGPIFESQEEVKEQWDLSTRVMKLLCDSSAVIIGFAVPKVTPNNYMSTPGGRTAGAYFNAGSLIVGFIGSFLTFTGMDREAPFSNAWFGLSLAGIGLLLGLIGTILTVGEISMVTGICGLLIGGSTVVIGLAATHYQIGGQ